MAEELDTVIAELLCLIERQGILLNSLKGLPLCVEYEELDRIVFEQANAIAIANGFFDYPSLLQEIMAKHGSEWCEKNGFFDIESA